MTSLRRRVWLQGAGAWLAGAGGLSTLIPTGSMAQSQPQSSAAAFEWPALDLLDGTVLPPEAWRDTGAVLVFWATHCPYCRRHNRHVEKLHRALSGQAVRVLSLSTDRDPAAVRRHMQQQDLSFPVTLQSERLRVRLGLNRTIPTTITVNRRGQVGLAIPGEMFEEDVMGLAQVAAMT